MGRKVKRTGAQKELALAELAKLMRRGYSKRGAARLLGVDEKQIRRDWQECLARLAQDRDTDTRVARDLMLEKYAEVVTEMWDAWERSKQDKEKATAEKVTVARVGEQGGETKGVDVQRTRVVKAVEGRLPDPGYMKVIVHCYDREMKLRGLDEQELARDEVRQIQFIEVVASRPSVPVAAEEY